MGVPTRDRGRLDPQPRPAHHRRRHAAAAALARPAPLPGLRPGPTRAWTSTRCSPGTRRAAGAKLHRAHHRHRPGARRAHRPGRRRHRAPVDDAAARRRRRHLPRARSSSPPTASPPGSPLALGLARREDRPMGVAVRTYFRSPRHDDDWLESWLELWDGEPGGSQPAARLRLDLRRRRRHEQRRARHPQLLRGVPQGRLPRPAAPLGRHDAAGVGVHATENQVGPIRGAALPMGFNREPHYTRGLLLVGDAGGMVNPFNGEGIAYAMESGAARRRGRRAGAGPARTRRRASGRCRPTPRR